MDRDAALDLYLSFDSHVTRVVGPVVKAQVEAAGQSAIYQLDSRLARIGREMSRIGIRIDPGIRLRFSIQYQAKANELRERFLQAAGREINPGSFKQVAKLFYVDLGLPILDNHLTDTGEPSTDEDTLLDILALGVDGRARTLIQSLLGWREADKILGTFVGRFEDGTVVGGPPVHQDGRLRTTWKVHGTTSGRWSSGSPYNLQNVPDKLREMFVPNPGNVFVGADSSAIEMRMQALEANDPIWIKAFDEFDRGVGPDVHTVNTCTIFGTTADKVTKTARRFGKVFVYGFQYCARPPRLFAEMSLLRDDDLEPIFPGLVLTEIERIYAKWNKDHPQIPRWRAALKRGWRKDGFIATRFHGRKRYFVAGEDEGEMCSHKIQGSSADLQNNAVLAIVGGYGFQANSYRGMMLQVHDQSVVECSPAEAPTVEKLIENAMSCEVGPMRFVAKAKTAMNWKELG